MLPTVEKSQLAILVWGVREWVVREWEIDLGSLREKTSWEGSTPYTSWLSPGVEISCRMEIPLEADFDPSNWFCDPSQLHVHGYCFEGHVTDLSLDCSLDYQAYAKIAWRGVCSQISTRAIGQTITTAEVHGGAVDYLRGVPLDDPELPKHLNPFWRASRFLTFLIALPICWQLDAFAFRYPWRKRQIHPSQWLKEVLYERAA